MKKIMLFLIVICSFILLVDSVYASENLVTYNCPDKVDFYFKLDYQKKLIGETNGEFSETPTSNIDIDISPFSLQIYDQGKNGAPDYYFFPNKLFLNHSQFLFTSYGYSIAVKQDENGVLCNMVDYDKNRIGIIAVDVDNNEIKKKKSTDFKCKIRDDQYYKDLNGFENLKKGLDSCVDYENKRVRSDVPETVLKGCRNYSSDLNDYLTKFKQYCAINYITSEHDIVDVISDYNSLLSKLPKFGDNAPNGKKADEDNDNNINSVSQTVEEINSNYEAAFSSTDLSNYYSDVEYTCNDLIDDDLKEVIQLILKLIRILAPIILIILVAVDMAQVVISSDKDAMPKAISKSIKRAIAALALFFVPFFVSLMIDWLDGPNSPLKTGNMDCSEVFDTNT